VARKDLYCTCGRPQSDHERGVGRSPTGCEQFKLRGKGGQLEVLGCTDPGDPPRRAPTYKVRCPRCKKEYETRDYLRDIIIRRSCAACAKRNRIRDPQRAHQAPLGMPRPERFLHGTRARYVGGCRCGACTEANAEYARMNQKMVRMGDTNKLVSAKRVKAHL